MMMKQQMNMKRVFHLIAILALATATSSAFGQEAMLRKADRLYDQYSFAQAIKAYERAFELGADDLGAARRLADSYRRVRDLGSSEKWYALIVGAEKADATDLYNYADALRVNGKYAQADSVMSAFAKHAPTDGRANAQANSAGQYGLLLVDPLFEGELSPVTINSESMDMGPSLLKGKLVFASNRVAEASVRLKYAWDDKPFLNLYIEEEGKVRLLKGTVNTRYHESNATFNAEGTEMYFTRNSYLDGKSEEGEDGFNNLHIYTSRLVNGVWTEEQAFPFNNASWSTGHPALSTDGKTLYFASNRPGGIGGVDIWSTTRDLSGQWLEPRNLGATINTEGDELFPCAHGTNALFFASDGRAGLGGSDVYLSWIFNGLPQTPVNLGAPVNSRADDMGFVLMADNVTGYFSSDRKGGAGDADIYGVVLDKPFEWHIRVQGRVVDRDTHEPLASIPVRIIRPDRSISAQQLTRADGTYSFVVPPQPMTVAAGVPGAGEVELPMDEHVILLEDEALSMPDIAVPSMFDVPVALRVLDRTTGLPVPGVDVRLTDSIGASLAINGPTDPYGGVSGFLAGVRSGDTVALVLTLTHPNGPGATMAFRLPIENSEAQQLERRIDMGRYVVAAVIEPMKSRYAMIDVEDPAKLGPRWAGRVVDKNDHLPVARVPITLLDIRGREIVRTITDAQGRYAMHSTLVPFSVRALLPGGEERVLDDISPFGDGSLPDIALNSVMDLPVNAMLTDAITGDAIEGVLVTVRDSRDGAILFTGSTNAFGACMGEIPDRRFGNDEVLNITFAKDDYTTATVSVDFSVLAFLEQALGGPDGFRLVPSLVGLDMGKAMRMRPILFDYNSAEIRAAAEDELDLLAQVMRLDTTIHLDLRAHTDSRGGAAFNQFLSVRRAQSTKAYLESEGISPDRLRAIGVGEREPVNRCMDEVTCSEAEHFENRRTEFIVTSSAPHGALSATGK